MGESRAMKVKRSLLLLCHCCCSAAIPHLAGEGLCVWVWAVVEVMGLDNPHVGTRVCIWVCCVRAFGF
jgi:hypothetical protein